MKETVYSVANHLFTVVMPEDHILWRYMEAYTPFEISDANGAKSVFRLEINDEYDFTSSAGEMRHFEGDMVNLTVILTDKTTEVTFKSTQSPALAKLTFDERFNATLIPDRSSAYDLFNLNNSLMLLYTLATSPYETLLFHASAVELDGNGYMFLGRSGAGKSTHSRQWVENVRHCSLLNDDNPVVRIIGKKIMVFGSPWSGKTPCYRNIGVELKGIVRIVQASANYILKQDTVKSYASVLPSCSCARWDAKHIREIHETVELLITNTGCYLLECQPNAKAAQLCLKEMLYAQD